MLSLPIAQKLKDAGLEWQPSLNDFFAIPDRGFDDQVFVISEVFANVERLRDRLAVTFHGTVEWALDHLLITELVWLPTEAQLLGELQKRLGGHGRSEVHLISTQQRHVCELYAGGQNPRFEAPSASEAYAAALLHLLSA